MSPRTVNQTCLATGLWLGLAACAATTDRPPDTAHAVVAGRCVAAEDGRPLPGCEIYLNTTVLNATASHENWRTAFAFDEVSRFEIEDSLEPPESGQASNTNWVRPYHLDRHFLDKPQLDALRRQGQLYQKPPDAITDADGRFRIEFRVADRSRLHCMYSLFTWSPHRLPWTDLDDGPEPGAVRDLGTLTLRLGQRVQGTVATADGAGIAGVSLRIEGLPACTSSALGGHFVFAHPIPPGSWTLRVAGASIANRTVPMAVGTRPWNADILVELQR